ncbi:hypothetical protein D3C81_1947990 [compost metagenome]
MWSTCYFYIMKRTFFDWSEDNESNPGVFAEKKPAGPHHSFLSFCRFAGNRGIDHGDHLQSIPEYEEGADPIH